MEKNTLFLKFLIINFFLFKNIENKSTNYFDIENICKSFYINISSFWNYNIKQIIVNNCNFHENNIIYANNEEIKPKNIKVLFESNENY